MPQRIDRQIGNSSVLCVRSKKWQKTQTNVRERERERRRRRRRSCCWFLSPRVKQGGQNANHGKDASQFGGRNTKRVLPILLWAGKNYPDLFQPWSIDPRKRMLDWRVKSPPSHGKYLQANKNERQPSLHHHSALKRARKVAE